MKYEDLLVTMRVEDFYKRNHESEFGPSILLFLLAGTGSMMGAGGLAMVTVLVITCLRVRLRGESKISFGELSDWTVRTKGPDLRELL